MKTQQIHEHMGVYREPQSRHFTFSWHRISYPDNHKSIRMFGMEEEHERIEGTTIGKINMREINEFERVLPTAYLNDAEAQNLIDSLYRAGLRPSDGTDNSNVIKRMDDHLQDMRTIAFNRLSIDKEK